MLTKPTRLNPRQELFAQNIAKGMPQSHAYVEAGYAPKAAEANASILIRNQKVVQRLAELRAPAILQAEVAATDIVRVAWQIAQDAEAHPGARVSALALLAKQFPEFSEKHEVKAEVDLVERRYIGVDVRLV